MRICGLFSEFWRPEEEVSSLAFVACQSAVLCVLTHYLSRVPVGPNPQVTSEGHHRSLNWDPPQQWKPERSAGCLWFNPPRARTVGPPLYGVLCCEWVANEFRQARPLWILTLAGRVPRKALGRRASSARYRSSFIGSLLPGVRGARASVTFPPPLPPPQSATTS